MPELAALEEGGGDRHPKDRDSDGRGKENENIEPQRERGAMPDGVDRPDRRIACQERKEDEGERLREGAQRQLRDGIGVAQRGHSTIGQRCAQNRVNEDVDLGRRQPQRDREHQAADFAYAGIVHPQPRRRTPAGPPERRQLDGDVEDGAHHDPHGERGHPIAWREEGGRHDDGAVVEERRQRLGEKSLICGENSDHHPAGAEEDWLQQQDPGERHDQLVVGGTVAERDQRHVPGRYHEQHRRPDRQDQDGGIEHPAGDLPGSFRLVLRQMFGEHRDEGGADGAGEQQIEQQVRDAERYPIVVEVVAGAKGVGDNELADRAQNATQPVGDQDERRGRRDAPPLA